MGGSGVLQAPCTEVPTEESAPLAAGVGAAVRILTQMP